MHSSGTNDRVMRAIASVIVCSAMLWACGGGAEDSGPAVEPVLSGEAARGKQLSTSRGCLSCHTTTGRRGGGPTWWGSFGSEVTLDDGRKVRVEEAYLVRAIKDPWAEKVKGYTTVMPRNTLPDDEVNAIVAYIRALGGNPAG